jgi:telomerase reverse transcriptase
MNASKLGSSMLSTGEIYSRLKEFKLALGSAASSQRFYFAKIDVHAAFDTIPQEAVIKLMNSVPSRGHYTVVKHVEMMPDPRTDSAHSKETSKSLRTWHFAALKKGEPFSLPERLERSISEKKINTVFVEGNPARTYHTAGLLKLLEEHVSQNIVKVGKRFYRQKRGIPQGSVVSSFLCNYFYADLEAEHLHFLNGADSILLRFMDDFLFITQDKEKAVQFVETMHRGVPDYGVEVNTKKTLLNFKMKSQDEPLATVSHGEKFPYCGTLIDCQTLEISRNHSKDPDNGEFSYKTDALSEHPVDLLIIRNRKLLDCRVWPAPRAKLREEDAP